MQYVKAQEDLRKNPKTWLVTGAAGFIGSNITQKLLELNQKVTGMDNFSTGHKHNLEDIKGQISSEQHNNFKFVETDIVDEKSCKELTKDINYVVHQAALGSVPRSMERPMDSHKNNVDGFINMLNAARENKVKRFVYASSSSVYGNEATLPKVEGRMGNVLSPYAATKKINEVYADAYAQAYGVSCVGLRYFNVYGRRQDPEGAYAAVIPLWVSSMLEEKQITINGDGSTSRDFCYIDNVVQANILSAVTDVGSISSRVYNVACFEKTSLNDLKDILSRLILEIKPSLKKPEAFYGEFRAGDIKHSLADISLIKKDLAYEPSHFILEGLKESINWYVKFIEEKGK